MNTDHTTFPKIVVLVGDEFYESGVRAVFALSNKSIPAVVHPDPIEHPRETRRRQQPFYRGLKKYRKHL